MTLSGESGCDDPVDDKAMVDTVSGHRLGEPKTTHDPVGTVILGQLEIASEDQWTGNPLIAEAVYRRISAGESSDHWLAWLLRDYFKKQRFARVLSPGCGAGDHEVAMMSFGCINQLDAFDFSEASLGIAREKAAAKNLNIDFYFDDINSFEVPADRKYDMVICSGSVHPSARSNGSSRVVKGAHRTACSCSTNTSGPLLGLPRAARRVRRLPRRCT